MTHNNLPQNPIARPAILAGAFIGIGGTAWLVVENRYAAAILFCIGLYAVCACSLWLFTGKVGYLPVCGEPGILYFGRLVLTWLGNFIGAAYVGMVAGAAVPGAIDKASAVVHTRLAQSPVQTLLLALICGAIMYVAVDAYNRHGSPVGILLGVPVFLLCGFEHSVADMFYFAAARVLAWRSIGHILLVTLGNSVGAILACMLAAKEVREERKQ